nr:unnamed protein product [Callosobruchus analis]
MDLCWKGKTVERKRGSPIPLIPKRKCLEYRPTDMVRTDNVGHWPSHTNERERCKRPSCTGKSRTMCEKCQVNLCLNKDNCFRTFHLRRA